MSSTQPLKPSEEADERHIQLARKAGDAYLDAADHMIEQVADAGARTEVGDYVVGFAQEKAEGMYRMDGGELKWEKPAQGENCHLEVLVASAADGRFLPGMHVEATLENEGGETVGPTEIPLVWHPGLYHYGRNIEIPGEGTYTITVDVDPATFPRHDEKNGNRFDEPAEVRFEDVQIKTGRK